MAGRIDYKNPAERSADDRNALNREKFDYRQEHDAMEAARKATEIESKAQYFEHKAALSDAAASLASERLNLEKQKTENAQLLKEQHEIARDKATVARQNAGIEFYKDAGALNPQSTDFRQRHAELMGKVYSRLVDSEGKIPEDVSKVSDHLFAQHNAWSAVQAKPEGPRDYGTQTVDDTGKVTTIRPIGAPGSSQEQAAARALLLSQHDALEKTVNTNSGNKQDAATIAQLNSLKARLGFAQIDPVTLKVVETQAAPNAPVKIAAAADFDALPSGAEFIDPQGVRRRKP